MKRTALCVASLAAINFIAGSAFAQVTFTNNTPITIPTQGTAVPYPSVINVSGYQGTITDITVTLNGFNHTFVDDLGVLFQGPGGFTTQGVWLTDGGPDGPTSTSPGVPGPIDITFSAAGAPFPGTGTELLGGTYLPGNNEYSDVMPAPYAGGTPATTFAPIIGLTDPNGDYNLYIADFIAGDGGAVNSWSVTISGITQIPEPTSLALLGIPAVAGWVIRRRRAK